MPGRSHNFPYTISAVLSWDVIIRILSEEDHISDQEGTKNESPYVHTVSFLWGHILAERLFS